MSRRVALIGAGFMAGAHAGAYREIPGAEIAAICSRSRERAGPLLAEHGADWTDDVMVAIERHDVDVVDICVPTDRHADLTIAALAAGKDVIVEKPIALDLDQADRVAKEVRRSGRYLAVAMALQFVPEYEALRQIADTGRLGAVESFSAYRLSPSADWNDWMVNPRRSGGVAVDLMTHDIDHALALLGPARSVSGQAVLADQHIHLQITHERGVSSIEGSMAMPRSFPFSFGFRLTGDRGVARYDAQIAPSDDGGNLGEGILAHPLIVTSGDARPEAEPVATSDPFVAELSYFLSCFEGSTAPERGTFEQARAALAVALAGRRSIETGAPCEVVG